jgi:dTDP-4-dehydrorhamnose reductase
MFLIGRGDHYFTPVDVRDLAEVMMTEMSRSTGKIISVGGPEDMSWTEICRTCFERYNRTPKIITVPETFCRFALKMLRPFSKSQYAMGKLMVFMSSGDFPSEKRGHRRFREYLRETI